MYDDWEYDTLTIQEPQRAQARWYTRLWPSCLGQGFLCCKKRKRVEFPLFLIGYDPVGQFQMAASVGDVASVERFINSQEYHINDCDRRSRTPLHYACAHNHPEVVRLLLSNSAYINIQDDEGCTPLIKATQRDNTECVSVLLMQGADPHPKDLSGNTALHHAISRGNTTVASKLLDYNADLNDNTKYGWTPYKLALFEGNQEMIQFLIQNGANTHSVVKPNSEGTSPEEAERSKEKHVTFDDKLHLNTDSMPLSGGGRPSQPIKPRLKKSVGITTDLSLLQEDLPEDGDGLGVDVCSSESDVIVIPSALDFVSQDEMLTPLGRLDKYAASENIFNRQMVARSLLDTLREVCDDEGDRIAMLERIGRLADDSEPTVRAELMEQVPHIALFCQENRPSIPYAFSKYLLLIVVRYLADQNNQVRKTSQGALLALLEQKLIERFDVETKVCPLLIELTALDSNDDVKTEAVAIMCKMAPMVGKDITERLILPRFCEVCYNCRKIEVRKVCAASFGDICRVVGQQATEEMLLPRFFQLCSDKRWIVRKACAECFMAVSCATCQEIRWTKLPALFINLICDPSLLVCQAAFRSLGPFISTFSNPSSSGQCFREGGKSSEELLNLNQDASVPLISAAEESMAATPHYDHGGADVIASGGFSPDEERRPKVQDVVPQVLLDQYLSMTEPSAAKTVDSEIAKHCAYSLPGVALTLGRQNWHCLRKTYKTLASHMQWEVRRTLAFSIHELAVILGVQLTAADLVPIFNGFLKDLDKVRIGVLKHLHDFLKLFHVDKRREYLHQLQEFLVTENSRNWRFRAELAGQLILLLELYSPRDVYDYFRPIALNLCADKVSSVRWISYKLVSEMVKKLHTATPPTFGIDLINELVEDFGRCPKWSGRQAFVSVCQTVIENDCLPMDQFAVHLMPHLLTLANDRVPNVRVLLAKTLRQTLLEKEYFLASASCHQDAVKQTIAALQMDRDSDVKYFASIHPSSTKISEDATSTLKPGIVVSSLLLPEPGLTALHQSGTTVGGPSSCQLIRRYSVRRVQPRMGLRPSKEPDAPVSLTEDEVEEKAEVTLLKPFEHDTTVVPTSDHLEPTSVHDGDTRNTVQASHKNDTDSSEDIALDPTKTFGICTGHARGRPYADPEPAPGHHTSDTMTPLNADPVLEVCLRAEHRCGRFTTDQESCLVHVPGDTPEPTQDTNKFIDSVNTSDYTSYTMNYSESICSLAANLPWLLVAYFIWVLILLLSIVTMVIHQINQVFHEENYTGAPSNERDEQDAAEADP